MGPADRGRSADPRERILGEAGAGSETRGRSSGLRPRLPGGGVRSPGGEQVAGELAAGLADEERVVVSGGAYGIEGAAHKSVLAASGQTIAVLANGLDRPYPAGHSELLNRIGDVGLLVSELPPGAAPTRHRFLSRNRLLAALSGATVIPEAGPGSGSMTTVIAARDSAEASARCPAR